MNEIERLFDINLNINKIGRITMKKTEKVENNQRVFARKVAAKLTEKEMQQVSGGETFPSGPQTPSEERDAENLN